MAKTIEQAQDQKNLLINNGFKAGEIKEYGNGFFFDFEFSIKAENGENETITGNVFEDYQDLINITINRIKENAEKQEKYKKIADSIVEHIEKNVSRPNNRLHKFLADRMSEDESRAALANLAQQIKCYDSEQNKILANIYGEKTLDIGKVISALI